MRSRIVLSAATRLRRYGNLEDSMMSEKLYRQYDRAHYSSLRCASKMRHLSAMTIEDLGSKSDIAKELAYRDDQIKELQAEVERLKSEQQGELWYALEYGFEGQYYELESIIEDFESDYGTGDIEEVKVAQLTTVKHPNKFLAKLWVDGDARLFDTREEAEAAIAESKEQAND